MKNIKTSYFPGLIIGTILLSFTACDVISTGTDDVPNLDHPCVQENIGYYINASHDRSFTANTPCRQDKHDRNTEPEWSSN